MADYNQRAIAALQRAQHLSGARSANAFARLLAERAGGSPSPTSYRRWITGEAVIPAWALEVAAEVVGTSGQGLLSEALKRPDAPDEWRTRIEDAIGRLEGEMIELREHIGMPWSAGTKSEEAPPARHASEG